MSDFGGILRSSAKLQHIHDKIHELEVLIAEEINRNQKNHPKAAKHLGYAHDNLCHQVAEWIRTAEQDLKK